MRREMEQYYKEYGRKVFLYLMTLCNDPDMAEELTQETFYQAIRTLHRYDERSSVYTWLCGIARHVWLRETERQTKHPVAEPDLTHPDPALSPAEITEQREEKMSVLRRIHALPEQEKEIILLRATGELSFREIGDIFGKSENWARITYFRAKQKLKGEKSK